MILPEEGNRGGGDSGEVEEATVILVWTLCRRGFSSVAAGWFCEYNKRSHV